MGKFTPGEWESGVLYGDHHVVFANEHAVVDCFGNKANALLVAAAPEMYELIRNFIAIDDMKVEASTNDNQPLYMRALFAQNGALKMARELIARVDSKETANE